MANMPVLGDVSHCREMMMANIPVLGDVSQCWDMMMANNRICQIFQSFRHFYHVMVFIFTLFFPDGSSKQIS